MTRWIRHPDWSDETAALLHDTLKRGFYLDVEVRDVWMSLGREPGDFSWSGSAAVLWPALTRDADEKGFLEDLIRRAQERKPALTEPLERVLAAELPGFAWYRCADRYRARLVGPGLQRALLDRSGLSAALRCLVNEDYPILSIQGGPGSGKSHSRHLIQHVAVGPQVQADLVIVDMGEEWPHDDEAVDVVDFVARLAQRLNIPADFAPDRFTESHRTAREMINEFVGRFSHLSRQYRWIFIDGLDRPNVTSGVQAFVTSLAAEVEKGQLGRTRLIITGHPGDFAPATMDVVLFERIGAVSEQDLELFFEDIAAHTNTSIERAVLDQLIKDVLTEISTVDLRSLGHRARVVAQRHFAQGGSQ